MEEFLNVQSNSFIKIDSISILEIDDVLLALLGICPVCVSEINKPVVIEDLLCNYCRNCETIFLL